MKRVLSLCFLCFSTLLVGQDVHVLGKNETLYQLSRRYNVSVDDIIRLNNIGDPRFLPVGIELKIPGRSPDAGKMENYTVQAGDTLFRIARRHQINAAELARINSMEVNDLLRIGQVLRVPVTVRATELPDEQPAGKKPQTSPFFWPHNGTRTAVNSKLNGIQISGRQGDPVYSVSTGRVIWAEPYRGYGNMVIIESPANLFYVYGGNHDFSIQVGDQVFPGTEIGKLGRNSSPSGARLFFSMYKNGNALDLEKTARH